MQKSNAITLALIIFAGFAILAMVLIVGMRETTSPQPSELDQYLANKAKCEAAGGKIVRRAMGIKIRMERNFCVIDGNDFQL